MVDMHDEYSCVKTLQKKVSSLTSATQSSKKGNVTWDALLISRVCVFGGVMIFPESI